MKRVFDVVVIGGGIIGLSTAYYLVKRHRKVLLIEKNEIGSGASGSCDEMILLQSKKPGILLKMALESLEIYKALSTELQIDLQFQSRGGMVLIEDEQQLQIMEEFVKEQRQQGLEVQIMERKDALKKQPHIHESIIASTFCKIDAQVNPLQVMRGFMTRGMGLGLEVMKKTDIQKIRQKGGYWRIDLVHGPYIETECIVNGAGAWASSIGKMMGVHIPIVPKRGQVLVTEQIPSIGETNVWSAKYIVRKIRPQLFREQQEKDGELGVGFALSQTASGNYLIGSTREYAGYNQETSYEALQIMVSQAMNFVPILKNVHIIRSFAGLRPSTPDGKPIMGEVEDKAGCFIAAGHEGDGIALAPITGKLMAELIEGKKIYYNLEELNLRRFVEGKRI